MHNYELIIIGAGPGGYEAAIHAGKQGLKTLLIEKEQLGGTCLNSGCIPTKTLLASVHLTQEIKGSAKLMGLNIPEMSVDYSKVVARKNRLLMRLRKGIEVQLKEAGVDVIAGEAVLTPGKVVVVNSTEYSAKNIMLATGSTSFQLPGLPFDGQKILNSTDLLNLETLPATLLIVGAGVIGLEMADLFSALGTKVTLVDLLPELLPNIDREAVALVQQELERQGCQFFFGEKFEAHLAGHDKVLVTVGRQPVTAFIQDQQIQLGAKKEVVVDENYQSTLPGVYAIGDINNLALYAHAATAQGLAVVDKILGEATDLTWANQNIPGVIFTQTQIATIGRTTDEVKKTNFSLLGKAQAENKSNGFIKMFLEDDVIVGVVLVGHNCDALIGEAVVLVNKKVKYSELKKMVHPHPTLSEIYAIS